MILLSHPTGNANVRFAVRAFHAAGWLRELDSCICWNSESPLARLLPAFIADQLARRTFVDVPIDLQHSHPWRELARLIMPGQFLKYHELGPLSVDAVYQSLDRHVANRLPGVEGLKAVYTYEDCALNTFKVAQELGIRRIYDLPIGYWRAAQHMFEQERELRPEWACTLTGLYDSRVKLARKDEELQRANLVIVASNFVRSTLLQYNACSAPVAVVPYGAPTALSVLPPSKSNGPLRVLYVGSLGQRKGLSYALEAVKLLGQQVSLTLIGKPTALNCLPLNSALQYHEHISSLPHHRILEQMRRHDVLLFPTLFDGYGLVITSHFYLLTPVRWRR